MLRGVVCKNGVSCCSTIFPSQLHEPPHPVGVTERKQSSEQFSLILLLFIASVQRCEPGLESVVL